MRVLEALHVGASRLQNAQAHWANTPAHYQRLAQHLGQTGFIAAANNRQCFTWTDPRVIDSMVSHISSVNTVCLMYTYLPSTKQHVYHEKLYKSNINDFLPVVRYLQMFT